MDPQDQPGQPGRTGRERSWLDEISFATKFVLVVTLLAIGVFLVVVIAELFV